MKKVRSTAPAPRPPRAAFERKLALMLHELQPTAGVFITEIHRLKWWVVQVNGPKDLEAEAFRAADRAVARMLRDSWPEKACRPADYALGRDAMGCHYSVYWLPVPPRRRVADFKYFYPRARL